MPSSRGPKPAQPLGLSVGELAFGRPFEAAVASELV
jgi:hypothetical protein